MKQHKSIKIETELIEKIEQLAKKENRSFNNMVETILQDRFPYTITINMTMSPELNKRVNDRISCEHSFEPASQRNGSPIVCSKCGFEKTGKFITN